MAQRRVVLTLSAALLVLACGDSGSGDSGADGGGSDSATGTSGITTSATSPSSADTTVSTSADSGDVTSVGDSSVSVGSDGATTGGGGDWCDGMVWQCNDGMDNDRDGTIDLEDPECTGPCDNDEGSFQTGLPGDNIDCFQDCFFDGNSGHGDDQCWWNITCDPANPGEGGMCEYMDSGMCMMEPPYDNAGFCVDACGPSTPPGCDCFGCCTVCTDDGCVDIWLGGGDDCAVDNLDACTSCTPQVDVCGNPCEPEECEVCIGQDAPPEGCDTPECENGLPCVDSGDCAQDFYCLLGCCYPPPPG